MTPYRFNFVTGREEDRQTETGEKTSEDTNFFQMLAGATQH